MEELMISPIGRPPITHDAYRHMMRRLRDSIVELIRTREDLRAFRRRQLRPLYRNETEHSDPTILSSRQIEENLRTAQADLRTLR